MRFKLHMLVLRKGSINMLLATPARNSQAATGGGGTIKSMMIFLIAV